ncbi:MAG: triphosphoribosyl-dephospho-CoA synthetase [Blastopirellula sp.]|nr:triphosphoribosyl-dephospho-CoA synthetase [Blastopirellula sp.]
MQSIGQCATFACLLEVTAPKVGNVHRGADFDDLTFLDFVSSAMAIGPAMETASSIGVGAAALAATQASLQATNSNAHLGAILLLAPLATVPLSVPLINGIGDVLRSLNRDDSEGVYQAIRLANPGGLGEVDEMDVRQQAPVDLLAAMHAAESRDLVARQYVSEFETVLAQAAVWIVQNMDQGCTLTEAIVRTQIQLLATHPDSLIARKCGREVAELTSSKARQVLESGAVHDPAYRDALADLDFWMRSDGNRRNPGTTADLITAALFVLLRERQLKPPFH